MIAKKSFIELNPSVTSNACAIIPRFARKCAGTTSDECANAKCCQMSYTNYPSCYHKPRSGSFTYSILKWQLLRLHDKNQSNYSLFVVTSVLNFE